jgi:hypothetical protein
MSKYRGKARVVFVVHFKADKLALEKLYSKRMSKYRQQRERRGSPLPFSTEQQTSWSGEAVEEENK